MKIADAMNKEAIRMLAETRDQWYREHRGEILAEMFQKNPELFEPINGYVN